jgi:alpha-ribazole phosphatase
MELIFIRHGKTPGNLAGRYVGRTDESLLPESREEILCRKMKNEYPPADIVFTSPMLRCIETARIIYPGKKIIEIPDFRECDFGEFEMKNYEELNGRADYQVWVDGGGKDPFPGGESMDMVRRRSMRGFYRAMELAYSGADSMTDQFLMESDPFMEPVNSVAFVVHGGTIMSILSVICGEDFYDYQTENGGCVTFSVEPPLM